MSETKIFRIKSGKIRTVREATAEEIASIEQDMTYRSKVAEEIKVSLAKVFTREKLDEVVARLPADLQAKYREQLQEPPVRYTFKFITRRSK